MGSKILYMLPALVLAFLALVLALVGLSRDPEPVTITSPQANEQAEQEQAAPSYEYWVLRQPLNAGDPLSEDNLAVVTSPTRIGGALPAEEDVFGRELRRYARPGELLSNHHLESGGSLPANLPQGQRAIAIAVDDVVGAGGLLQPGDRVDVVTAFRRSDKDAPVALVMLREVPVLAVYGSLSAGADEEEGARRRNNTAVLSVPEERVSALMLASSEGKVRLAVVAGERGDTRPGDDSEPAGDGEQSLAAAEAPQPKPFYFDDFFPEREKPAPATAPTPSPGQRVQVFEGAESRSTYVR